MRRLVLLLICVCLAGVATDAEQGRMRRRVRGGSGGGGGGGGGETLLTTLTLQNTDGSVATPGQSFVTFGHGFKRGDVPSGQIITAKNAADSVAIPIQADQRTTWDDGSLRWGAFAIRAPSVSGGGTLTVNLYKNTGTWNNTQTRSVDDIDATAGRDFKITLASLAGVTNSNNNGSGAWTAAANDALAISAQTEKTRSGPIVDEWRTWIKFDDDTGGALHNHLIAIFYIRVFTKADGTAGPIVHTAKTESPWMTVTDPDAYTYTAAYKDGASTIRSFASFTHTARTGWFTHDTDALWDWTADEPTINPQHNTTYLRATGLIPPYDLTIVPSTSDAAVTLQNYTPMSAGAISKGLGDTSEKEQMGPLGSYVVRHILTQGKNYRRNVFVNSLAFAGGPFTWRTVATAKVPTILNEDYFGVGTKSVNSWWYANNNKSTDVPTINGGLNGWVGDGNSAGGFTGSHWPNFNYYPYLITGDRPWRDALEMEANQMVFCRNAQTNYRWITYNGNLHYGNAMVQSASVRTAAWSLRSFANAGAILPDGTAEKDYFEDLMVDNLGIIYDYLSESQYSSQIPLGIWYFESPSHDVDGPFMRVYLTLAAAWTRALYPSNTTAQWLTEHQAKFVRSLMDDADATYAANVFRTNIRHAPSGTNNWVTVATDIMFSIGNGGAITIAFDAATGVCTWSGLGTPDPPLAVGTRVRFTTTNDSFQTGRPAPPTPVTTGVVYYLRQVNVGAKTFKVATANDEASIITSFDSSVSGVNMYVRQADFPDTGFVGDGETNPTSYSTRTTSAAGALNIVGVPNMLTAWTNGRARWTGSAASDPKYTYVFSLP